MEPTQHRTRGAALVEQAKTKTRERIRGDAKGAPEDVAEILEVIAQGIFRPRFDLSDVRRECAPSAETLRAFRVRVGSAFKSYLTDRLLETAAPLVDELDVDLAEIASELGFASALSFSRWFRRWTGKTPEERRAALRRTRPAESAAADDPLIVLWFRARVGALGHQDAALLVRLIRSQVRRRRRGTRT